MYQLQRKMILTSHKERSALTLEVLRDIGSHRLDDANDIATENGVDLAYHLGVLAAVKFS